MTPDEVDLTLRERVALDYIKDGQRQWNHLDSEERHGSLEMARWAIESADREELERHIFTVDELEPQNR